MVLLKSIDTEGIVSLSDGTRWRLLSHKDGVIGRWLEGEDIDVSPHPERGDGVHHLNNVSMGEGVDAVAMPKT